jgi:hypothetical protein
MHFMYGFCNGNSLVALSEYQHQYAYQRQPYQRISKTMNHNLRETGSLMSHARACRGRHNVQDEEDMLDIIHDNS